MERGGALVRRWDANQGVLVLPYGGGEPGSSCRRAIKQLCEKQSTGMQRHRTRNFPRRKIDEQASEKNRKATGLGEGTAGKVYFGDWKRLTAEGEKGETMKGTRVTGVARRRNANSNLAKKTQSGGGTICGKSPTDPKGM